ncbi:MAG: hypothetical protein AAF682_16015 [Planctomycetota bacterium]
MKPLAMLAPLALVLLAQEEFEKPAFQGTPVEAMAAIARLATEEPARAVVLAQEFSADDERPEPLRAEFHYAEGVVRHMQGAWASSEVRLLSAAALAGPGELRLAALYNLGTLRLESAERLRVSFAEMAQAAAAGQPREDRELPDDPIAVLRSAYLSAKVELLDRLKLDFAHEDTRANLELVQRRLRELDEAEQPEEEPDQEDQEPQDEQEGEDQEQQDGEQSEDGEPQEDGEDQEQQGEDQPQEDGQQPEDPPDDPGEGAADQTSNDQQRPTEELPEPMPHETSADTAERVLSREEVLRLLDQLKQLEEEAQSLEALLRQSRRIPVEKDW